jgi:hypothetical protein
VKPVFQTIQGDNGNCLQACVASIFELPLEEVPHFLEADEGWFERFAAWLRERDLVYINYKLTPEGMETNANAMKELGADHYHIIGGKSGTSNHVCVAQFGRIVHDPHPKLDSPWWGYLAPDDDGMYEIAFFVKRFVVLRVE